MHQSGQCAPGGDCPVMSTRFLQSPWNVTNSVLAALLVLTAFGGPRRLPPDGLLLQTWSMHWVGPDGKPQSENFTIQTFNPRQEFGPFLHEYHWFGPPTMEPPVMPGSNRLIGR